MPAFWEYPPPSHDYPYYWFISDPMSKQGKVSYKFEKFAKNSKFCKKLYMRHTFRSCLIICVNMKWIWLILWKLQSWHDSVHRWTDGPTTWNQYTPFQLRWSGGYKNVSSIQSHFFFQVSVDIKDNIPSIHCKIALRWKPHALTDD